MQNKQCSAQHERSTTLNLDPDNLNFLRDDTFDMDDFDRLLTIDENDELCSLQAIRTMHPQNPYLLINYQINLS